jgi:hypothetical protein
MRHPLTAKGLLLLNLAALATVRRRLSRLVRLGVVQKSRIQRDGRIQQMKLDRGVRLN